jgi:protein TonB
MFGTLESTWDHSAHLGWTAFASYTLQIAGIGILLLLPMLSIQEPPALTWIEPPILVPPPGPTPVPRVERTNPAPNFRKGPLQEPRFIPNTIVNLNESQIVPAPDLDNDVPGGTNTRGDGIEHSIGTSLNVVPVPPAPVPARPLKISHWSEGNVIFRVQPNYPALARQARIQGAVELRAIISRSGTIENLIVISGHPMLVRSAIDAVRQWRYRPYLLNNEPIEVETEITVNFTISDR